MTVYKWQVAEISAYPLQGTRRAYGLPPIEWFSHLFPGTDFGMKQEDILALGQTRRELLAALEDSLSDAPAQGEMTEIILEALNTGYSLYRMDYHGKEIELSRILDVLVE